MTSTTWFVRESKSFMGYGKHISKRSFWAYFPIAFCKFYFYELKNTLRGK